MTRWQAAKQATHTWSAQRPHKPTASLHAVNPPPSTLEPHDAPHRPHRHSQHFLLHTRPRKKSKRAAVASRQQRYNPPHRRHRFSTAALYAPAACPRSWLPFGAPGTTPADWQVCSPFPVVWAAGTIASSAALRRQAEYHDARCCGIPAGDAAVAPTTDLELPYKPSGLLRTMFIMISTPCMPPAKALLTLSECAVCTSQFRCLCSTLPH
jgi:hypothetical protein